MATESYSVTLMVNGSGNGAPVQWVGGRGFFSAISSNWGGGSASIQYRGPDGVTWLSTPAISLTADGGAVFDLPPCEIRGITNTATGVTSAAARIP